MASDSYERKSNEQNEYTQEEEKQMHCKVEKKSKSRNALTSGIFCLYKILKKKLNSKK